MAWLEIQWKCQRKGCGYQQREILGPQPENQSARCRMCKAQHHLNVTPRVTVELFDTEDEDE